MNPTRQPCARQPQWPSPVDWLNPLTKGLIAAINPAIRCDMVTGASLIFSGATLEARKAGRAALSNGSSTFSYVDLPSRTYTQGTILAVTEPSALAMNTGVVQIASMASSNPIVSIRTGNTTSSSKIRLWLRGDDGGSVGEGRGDGALDAFAVGKTSVAAITFKVGGRYYAFANGVKDTKSESVSSTAFTLSRVAIGALSFAGGSGDFYNGATSLVLFFGRVLTDAEIAALSANPWRIFRGQSPLPLAATPVSPQLLSPTGQLAGSTWIASNGGALYTCVDESAPDEADYTYTTTPGAWEEFTFPSGGAVSAAGGHVRYRIPAGSGSVTVELRQGSTVLQTWGPHTLSGSLQAFDQTITAGTSDSSDLRVRFTAS